MPPPPAPAPPQGSLRRPLHRASGRKEMDPGLCPACGWVWGRRRQRGRPGAVGAVIDGGSGGPIDGWGAVGRKKAAVALASWGVEVVNPCENSEGHLGSRRWLCPPSPPRGVRTSVGRAGAGGAYP